MDWRLWTFDFLTGMLSSVETDKRKSVRRRSQPATAKTLSSTPVNVFELLWEPCGLSPLAARMRRWSLSAEASSARTWNRSVESCILGSVQLTPWLEDLWPTTASARCAPMTVHQPRADGVPTMACHRQARHWPWKACTRSEASGQGLVIGLRKASRGTCAETRVRFGRFFV